MYVSHEKHNLKINIDFSSINSPLPRITLHKFSFMYTTYNVYFKITGLSAIYFFMSAYIFVR